MRSPLVVRPLFPALVLAALSTLPLHAAVQNRITQAVSNSSRSPIPHTISSRAKLAADEGQAPSNRKLDGVTLYFNMTAAQQADLLQLLQDQQNPNSASYHQWLTPAQFGARFGLSSADLTKVSSWLTSQGLTIVSIPSSSNKIIVSGTVPQIEQAFSTSIHTMSENGVQHVSNVTDPQLPTVIANLVTGITGLNDFKPMSRSRVSVVNPKFTSSATGNHYIAPGDFYTIYDVSPLLSNSINGTGLSIAIAGQTDITTSDVTAFRNASGLSANLPKIVQATGYVSGIVSGDVDEASLDVEWSGAVAPNATIYFVTVGAAQSYSVTDALAYAIDNKIAPIVSISYGNCETAWGQSNLNSINQVLQQANAEGITVVGPGGDSGATDCDSTGLATEGLAVDFPASSPYVTGVGGTMFNEGSTTGATQYWNTNNSSSTNNAGSALSYIPEAVWNETTTSTGLTAGGAGGGGASAFFSKPAWQTGTGVPADSARDVPDLSLDAAANHDGYLFCVSGSCTNGFANSSGVYNVVGGTSVSTPSFAGILALLEQKLATGALGNVNPTLYGLANIANVYHDITVGSNAVPCVQGTPNCPSGGSIGFSAGTGYDQATGLGTVDTTQFVNNWTAAVPTGGGSTIGTQQSNTTLTTSSVTCGLTTTSLPFAVTVAGVSSTTTPTGTVQLYIDNKAYGSPVTLTGGSAQLTLDTTTLTSGSHNVNAVYSGDSTFAGSRGALLSNTSNTGIITQIDVVSTTSADFSVTPCTGSTTVASGSAASPITITITPTAGFTGSVNLTATSDSTALGYAFSVQPVSVTTSSGVTTQFTLTASTTTATAANRLHSSTSHKPQGKAPWYAAGSGATLACLILITVPRRRRWGALFALMLSVAVISASGCGSSSSTTGGNNGGGGTTTTPAATGTYNITITATSGSRVHSVVYTYNVVQ